MHVISLSGIGVARIFCVSISPIPHTPPTPLTRAVQQVLQFGDGFRRLLEQHVVLAHAATTHDILLLRHALLFLLDAATRVRHHLQQLRLVHLLLYPSHPDATPTGVGENEDEE